MRFDMFDRSEGISCLYQKLKQDETACFEESEITQPDPKNLRQSYPQTGTGVEPEL